MVVCATTSKPCHSDAAFGTTNSTYAMPASLAARRRAMAVRRTAPAAVATGRGPRDGGGVGGAGGAGGAGAGGAGGAGGTGGAGTAGTAGAAVACPSASAESPSESEAATCRAADSASRQPAARGARPPWHACRRRRDGRPASAAAGATRPPLAPATCQECLVKGRKSGGTCTSFNMHAHVH
eukprot:scaffold90068_cov69-Phaeocystis_antarctica.AAC.1